MSEAVAWVTGPRGFIGQHLCARLSGSGTKVIGFGRHQSTEYNLDSDGFLRALAEHGVPDRIFHLAGGATVGQSIVDPFYDFQSNVVTTALLLDAVREHCPSTPIVMGSSAAVYGNGHLDEIDTTSPINPSSPYGYHKYMAETIVRGHAEIFGLRVTVVRLFSIYGSGLRKQLLFDICTRLAAGRTTLMLSGTGEERRDWCHVSDAVTAMCQVEAPELGIPQVFNLGSGKPTTIRAIAEALRTVWRQDFEIEFSGVSRQGDPFSLMAAKSSMPLNFAPNVPLVQGLGHYVDWFRQLGGTGR